MSASVAGAQMISELQMETSSKMDEYEPNEEEEEELDGRRASIWAHLSNSRRD